MLQPHRRHFLKQASWAGLVFTGPASSADQLVKETKPLAPALRTLVLEGTPHHRGLKHGKALKDQIQELVKLWKEDLAERFKTDADRFIKRFAQQTNYTASIKKWTPDLLDEIKGIAEGAGLGFDTMLVFQLMDEYLVNGSALAEHCSSLGWPRSPDHASHIAQNLDLEGFRHGFQVLLRIKEQGSDLESVVVSHAGLIGWNGMNNKSIGVCCNTLSQLSNCRDGLPVNCIVRGLLQQRTEDEAVKFLRRVKHASGQNYIIGGLQSVFSFECSAGKVSQFKPDEKRGLVWHTNHPLVNDDYNPKFRLALKSDRKPAESSTSARLRCLESHLNKQETPLTLEFIKSILASHDSAEFPVCRPLKNKKDNFTFAGTIMVLSDRPVLHVAAGPPDSTVFQVFSFSQ